VDSLVGNQTQEGRLFQLYCQPLAKGPVKDRIACVVSKVGENDGIPIGESGLISKVLPVKI
jgi:hypothetical protein